MKTQLSNYIELHKEQTLSDLARFVSIPSESDNPKVLTTAIDFIIELAQEMGFVAKRCCDGQVAVIEMGPTLEAWSANKMCHTPETLETLGILSHIDAVPAGDPKNCNTPPYEATIIDDKIFGRGTLDEKA